MRYVQNIYPSPFCKKCRLFRTKLQVTEFGPCPIANNKNDNNNNNNNDNNDNDNDNTNIEVRFEGQTINSLF